jgi:HK97 family phage portal protein
MAYVVTDGALANLQAFEKPRAASLQLGSHSFAYGELWRTQPQLRTVVDFLARNIAQIGLPLFRRVSDTDRERVTDHPLAALVKRPNPRTTRYRLFDSLVHDVAIYDVACWVKTKGPGLLRLPPAMLEPIGESWVDLDGVKLRGARGSTKFGLDELVLFRGYSPTGSWGTPPAETLRQILLEEWNATVYRQQLWRNGARIPGTIERPQGAKWSPRAREDFKADWAGLYTGDGPGTGGTPVLEDGMKFNPSGVSPKEAEYISARKLTREEVAAAYHVPLPMVGILDHATFSNVKEQHQQLYQDCLGPWLVMIQEELALQLVPDFDSSGGLYFDFNLDAKMRGSFEEQATTLQTAVGGPWMTRNEARGRVNLPAVDGGDDLIVPLNVITGGQASPTDSAPKSGDDLARIQAAIRAAIGG